MITEIKLERDDRVLFLHKDPYVIQRQLQGENVGPFFKEQLLDGVSTDTFPTRACFRSDSEHLARFALTGLRIGQDQTIPQNAIKDGKFKVLVAGNNFGIGSSREHFPWSLQAAGIEIIAARSMGSICAKNCQNIGLIYLEQDNFDLIYQLIRGSPILIDQVVANLDEISAQIVKSGGLFKYFGKHSPNLFPKPQTTPRPMTAPEKIIASHMEVDSVQPGDVGFINVDQRYSYEIFLPASYAIFRENLPLGEILDPNSVILFYDHSVLDSSLDAHGLATQMRQIAKDEGLLLYDGNRILGAEGICHTIMLEKHALPSQLIVGTDSHTCTLGAVGALPIGIGATEWAASLINKQIRISVPSSIRVVLNGKPSLDIMSKDIMLYLLSTPYIQKGYGIGKIFEFTGDSLDHLNFDEQVVFSNMAVEGGGVSAYIKPNQQTIDFMQRVRGLSLNNLQREFLYSDDQAEYDHEIVIDCSSLEPYIALPGNPCNGIPIKEIFSNRPGQQYIQKAYIGSCTGSKEYDLSVAASVLEGRTVHPDVRLYIQASSRRVYETALKNGWIKIFEDAGANIIQPGCGACVNFGPGSIEKGEIGISSTNRNFLGRMGQGEVYLANPKVVAASAVAGKIALPDQIRIN